MKATINIQEDAELRAAVKDMVRGQVKNIIREEIKEIVNEEIKGVIRETIEKKLPDITKLEVSKSIQAIVGPYSYSNSQKIIAMAKESVDNRVKELLDPNMTAYKGEAIKIATDRLAQAVSTDLIVKKLVEKLMKKE